MRSLTILLSVFVLASVVPLEVAHARVAWDNPPMARLDDRPDTAPPTERNGPNLILNGDFENTTLVGCHFNLTNAEFTLAMGNVTAFGGAQELDIMNDTGNCGYLGPPQSGSVKIGCSADSLGGPVDAFSFELATPVVQGQCYRISFYGWLFAQDFAPDIGPTVIGLSNSATEFGTQIFSGTPSTTGWTLFTYTFAAPVGAAYLTVKAASAGDTWTHLDNFSLVEASPSAAFETSWGTVKSLYR